MSKAWILCAAMALGLPGCAGPAPPPGYAVAVGDLRVEYRGNVRADGEWWLSGVTRLANVRGGGNAWMREGSGDGESRQSAGLNFEHIVTVRADPRNYMEPRHGPFDIADATSSGVTLVRPAAASAWGVGTRMRYDAVAPHYIDFSFDSEVTRAAEFGPDRACVFFFASYMTEPVDEAAGGANTNFLGTASAGAPETWCRSDPAVFGATFIGAGASGLAPGSDLSTGHSEWPRMTRPFVYGRMADGNVLILMLDHLGGTFGGYGGPDEEAAFILLKWIKDGKRRPAWDFSYRVRNLVDGTRVRFRGRLVWKRWVSADDARLEFEGWYAGLGAR